MKHILALLFCTLLSVQAFSDSSGYDIDSGFDFLSKREIRQLLGDYPTLGSLDGQEDLDILLEYQRTRTQEQCEYAASQDSVSVENLFVKNGGPISKKEAKKLKWRLARWYVEAGINIWKAKRLYKRPRPYDSHSELKPCIPRESSYSYPSGHTTLGRVLARVLSEIYPERAALIMKRGNEVSKNRIIGGVHYPSDVAAGKILGDEIADVVIKSKWFDQYR